ncbi:MAG TPA: hypothetical protein VFX59_20030 [Polyangiales bacterium]|nr:hypothetical protein [Polyangiales bacterium]
MRRSSLYWIVLGCVLSLGAIGCTDEGVGDPCTPETVPCDSNGENCGYKASESYIEATSVQCKSRLCIVHKLDNLTEGLYGADPRKLCGEEEDDPTCVDPDQLLKSVYCTCRCDTPSGGNSNDLCSCPSGFSCREILNLGGPGIVGSYCVKGDG